MIILLTLSLIFLNNLTISANSINKRKINTSNKATKVSVSKKSKKVKLQNKAQNFTLEDQFGNKISVAFPSDKVVVLVFGDRKGSEQVEKWVRPLYEKFTDQIYIFGIAELSVVPWAVRPVVRGIIKSKSKTPVMLDWTGKISKSYGVEKEKANLFVVNKNGSIVSVKRGAATSATLSSLYKEIGAIL